MIHAIHVTVSVIIVSYNTRDVTCRCLESILQQTHGLSYEVILVDNASMDGSVDKIRREFPTVKIIESNRNLGFGAAQNLGMQYASGEYLLVLNSDVIIVDDAITTLARALQAGPKRLAVVGPRVVQVNGTLAPSARRARLGTPLQVLGVVNRHLRFKRFLPEEALRRVAGPVLGRFHDNFRPHTTREQVDFVDGMCALVTRDALEEVGLFDEQYFFDYEIADLANRMRSHGWTIEFIPEAEVIHIGHVSRKKTSRILIETIRSELTYYAKHFPNDLALIRTVNEILSLAKYGYFRVTRALKNNDDEQDIYREILKVCREFDPQRARCEDRIPRFCQMKSGEQARGHDG